MPNPDPLHTPTADEAPAPEHLTQETDLPAPTAGQPGWGAISKTIGEPPRGARRDNARPQQHAKYSVEVHTQHESIPEGLQCVLEMLGEAIAPRPATPTDDSYAGPAATTPTTPTTPKPAP